MRGIVDDAYLKEKRIRRSRLIHRRLRICFRTVGWPSDDDFDAKGTDHRAASLAGKPVWRKTLRALISALPVTSNAACSDFISVCWFHMCCWQRS
jgi:hypothetical protein